MNNLRALFCLLLIISMMLPLSKCEYMTMTEDGKQAEPTVIVRYVMPQTEGASRYIWILPFLIPAGFTFFMYKRKSSKLVEVGHLATLIPVSLVIWTHGGFGSLALGGYISLVSIIGLFLIVLCSNLRAS